MLGLEFRGPSYCAEWSYDQGWLEGSDPHSPTIDTNTGIDHSCDVDTLLNVIACLHLLMLLVWMAWIIYEVKCLPFDKSERRLAFRCGVSRILRGEYDLAGMRRGRPDPRGEMLGHGGLGEFSRRTSVDAKRSNVEMGNMSGAVSGFAEHTAPKADTDTGTGTDTSMSVGTGIGGGATDLASSGDAGPANIYGSTRSRSPRSTSPLIMESTHPHRAATEPVPQTNFVPPLPPRPILRPPIGTSNSGFNTPTIAASSSVTDLPHGESQTATDIPPPAYEHNGPQSSEPGSTITSAGASIMRTMDFDAFMRAQQHKAEYKLYLERQERRAAGQEGDREPGAGGESSWGSVYGYGMSPMSGPSESGWGAGRMENGRPRRGSY